MAKTLVLDGAEGTRVPFLRGILTRSLQEAGVPFREAYALASRIRQEVTERDEVSARDLRERVVRHLRRDFPPEVVERYRSPPQASAPIWVLDATGTRSPFSRTRYRLALETCGVGHERAQALAERMYLHLRRDGKTELSSAVLGRLTHRWLRRDPGPEAARRYLAWTAYRRSDRPLVVLIGGTVGCGKSTIATEVASRLGIVRIQSTDMLREVMRMMLPERLLPVLHTSSFNAWQVLPLARGSRGDRDALVAEGYRSQAELVSVPCEAVVRRALQEQVSLVLEGVHVQPDLAGRLPAADEAIVVPLVLAVLSPEQLQRRLRGRGELTPQRRAHRYLRQFDAIWSLQGHILAEADRLGVPIIPNDERMRAVQAVLSTVVDALVARFEGTPRQVLRRFR